MLRTDHTLHTTFRISLAVSMAVLACLAMVGSGPAHSQAPAATTASAAAPPGADGNPEATPNGHPLDIDRGAAGLWQTLLNPNTRASLLMVTAHPDDEDGGMLTYESRGQGARGVLLKLNRGGGGD